MMTKTALSLVFAGLAASLFATPVLADPPQAKIVVIDRAAILRFSKVGQDIAKQMQAYANQAKADLSAQGKALQAEGRNLQQQVAILAPDVKQKRLDAFRAREEALQGAAQRKDEQLKAALAQGQQAMEQQLGPILQQLVKERNANLVLDKQAVVFANANGFDITGDAINRLNQKMPAFKINLNAPPPAAPKK
jgi:Skp family chaperone for outer membrane proteins